MKKKIITLLGLCALYLGLEQAVELVTHGFCVERIKAPLLRAAASDSVPEDPSLKEMLAQPFYMIGAGSECFAFASKDGNTVIKFFKLDLFRPVYLHRGLFKEDHSALAGMLFVSPSMPTLFTPFVNRLLGIREFRVQRTFESIRIAHDRLCDQTALIHLHLPPSSALDQTILLYDGSGIAHQVDLGQTPFLLQQRAIPLLAHFENLVAQERDIDAQQSIDSLLHLLFHRCQQGVSDRDIVMRNFGFIDNRAIEIDTGSFAECPAMKQHWLYSQEIAYATLDLKRWLKEHAPHLAIYLEQRVNETIS